MLRFVLENAINSCMVKCFFSCSLQQFIMITATKEVMYVFLFVCLFVCLSVCQQDYACSESCGWIFLEIFGMGKPWFNKKSFTHFVNVLDTDLEILSLFFWRCESGLLIHFHHRISAYGFTTPSSHHSQRSTTFCEVFLVSLV